ncbi:MAG: NUDIX domain-containing protein [Clostridia bacterium]|nr:NUDIX domain-containing protein [Clostridia bacterium]
MINIGYADKLSSPSGRPLRAYVYGVRYPIRRYVGSIIAYGKAEGGDDFIVVADKKLIAYDVNIIPLIERYEKGKYVLHTSYEKSCGAIIYRRIDNEIKFLLVKQRLSNSWSFPKGHIVYGESEQETAAREVREEVGMSISFEHGFRIEQFYQIRPSTVKKVVIFLAKSDDEITIDNDEIVSYAWVDENSVPKYLHKKDAVYVIKRAKNHIIKNNL